MTPIPLLPRWWMKRFVRERMAVFGVAMAMSTLGCDGGSTGGSTVATGGMGGSGVGGAGGAGGTNAGPTGCPASEPMNGAACAKQDLHCSYGESPFPMCRHRYRCDMGKWAQSGGFCQQEPAA